VSIRIDHKDCVPNQLVLGKLQPDYDLKAGIEGEFRRITLLGSTQRLKGKFATLVEF